MRLHKLMKLVFWIVLFESIGFLLGLLTQANIYPWYEHLNKSSLTPPGFVFSVVWTLLYVLLALIAWILTNQNQESSKKITVLFALQMLMNWVWTPLFFGLHWFMLSALWLVSLTCLNLILIIEAKKTHKTIAWLLTPYLLWLVFASYLNVVIALMN
ncbi:TspO/MBR family protein [Legionella bononiensis]|uniref:Tryptophan-rich sensory protein n=1 Tax=Legionella bononiensis TaxID=2793102 RepID=A0ABS1WAN0_9GAMM|nr:TspO/MBR family protein [Legionella bononiensis]MBL7480361.1 tryptophan-rich sensory protein [Legionella bononiensis]MBL7526407.1 tryptophan-rich sensory protein [Legionella bononiensis]MBL7563099.1 tryptophan-rich sensory protein [Legionella bononiensis]